MAQETPVRIFLAFEGGGAKGIVHIGALRALEERNILMKGVSGTSAGAIVASLAAAGFTADEMVDPERGTSILGVVNQSFRSPADLFGKKDWRAIRWLRRFCKKPWQSIAAAAVVVYVTTAFAIRSYGVMLGSLALLAWCVLVAYILYRLIRGFAGLDSLQETLNVMLRSKLDLPEDEVVCFRHFGGNTGRPTLKIVTTNITSGELQLFSPECTPNVSVAEAVAASACIPIVFQPRRIGEHLHLDGGFLSNLPAWPFDEERELDKGAMTVALEITEAVAGSSSSGRWWRGKLNQLMFAAQSILFGASVLSKRTLGRLAVVNLPTTLRVLDFDVNSDVYFRTVKEATAAARIAIGQRLFEIPALLDSLSEALRGELCTLTEGHSALKNGSGKQCRLRVGLAIRPRDYHQALRLGHCSGFGNDADCTLLLPVENTYVGQAFRSREPYFVDSATLSQYRTLALRPPELRQVVASMWPEMAWCLCVPAWHPQVDKAEMPWMVVTIDGNHDWDWESPEKVADLANALSQKAYEIVELVLKGLPASDARILQE